MGNGEAGGRGDAGMRGRKTARLGGHRVFLRLGHGRPARSRLLMSDFGRQLVSGGLAWMLSTATRSRPLRDSALSLSGQAVTGMVESLWPGRTETTTW